MDSLDKAFIFELTKNCRISFSDLAGHHNISVEEVNSRVLQLVRDHIILKFTIVPVPALFGAEEALLLFHSTEPLDMDRITLLGINPAVEYISVGNQIEGFAKIHYRVPREINEVQEYFEQFHPAFDRITILPIQTLPEEDRKQPKLDLISFEKIDWLILTHLREQGRLPLDDLSRRTNIAIETLVERLEFLRFNELIEETIHLNPAKSQKETWTIFCLELTLFSQPLYEEINQELSSLYSYFNCWKVIDKPILLLGFLCSSYTEVEKIQASLSDTPGVKSIEKIMGGATYYFPDFRDEALEEKRSHGWFSPEQWIVDREG